MLTKGRFMVHNDYQNNSVIYTITVPLADLIELELTKTEQEKLKKINLEFACLPISEVLDALKLIVTKIEQKNGDKND